MAAPPNDRCVDAIEMENGIPYEGDVSDANFDFTNQGVCGPNSDTSGIWYKIIGTGTEATVDVCTKNEKITTFGILLACNNNDPSVCRGHPSQTEEIMNCGMQNLTYSFTTVEDTLYFVNVRSKVEQPGVGGSMFTVVYTHEPVPVTPTMAPVMPPTSAAPRSLSAFSLLGIAFGGFVVALL